MKENFTAETKSFKELFMSDSIYIIPPYQRDYSWNNENSEWEDLWNDITSADTKHYVGFIVLKEREDDKLIEVIDGQQRLATIVLIILSTLNLLKDYIANNKDINKDAENRRLQLLKSDYIGREDSISLTFYNKLKLNKINDPFFQYLCQSKTENDHLCFSGKKAKSNKLLELAFNYFRKKVNAAIPMIDGENISKFLEKITQKLFFTVLYVNTDANAYTLFETLNARGMKLAAVDLLKNFLYSKVSLNLEHLDAMQNHWQEISTHIKEGDLNKFIRTDWGSRNDLVEDRRLYNVISKKISNDKSAFAYVKDLKESSIYFSLLQNPQDAYWKQSGFNQDICQYLDNLQQLQIKQIYGVLIAYLKKIGSNNFHTLVKWAENISFRFNTISSLDAKEQEKIYNEIAIKISTGEITGLNDIKKYLKKVYVKQEDFLLKFSKVEIKRTATIKYILNKLNQQMGGPSLNLNDYTVEHILSQNRNNDWTTFSEPEDFIWRLGNLTLLEKNTNEDLDNKIFIQKKEIYQKDINPITNSLAAFDNWNETAIDKRQNSLTDFAKIIWRISELEE